ncbi:sensor histidine kinase [Clostridium sp. DJ247]|uniref:sensor histidine kinase n=1 Tax=Clostridium sp. DJ247 TaxID=2726188 RepID=UPI001F4C8DA5|nr:sensor histidine kinase [Clostridium sp. DJ247]
MIFLINRFDITSISIGLYLFILSDIVVNQSFSTGLIAFFTLYAISCVSILTKLYYDNVKAISEILLNLPIFIVVYIIFFLINHLLKQTELIEAALKDVTVKKLEKDSMYNDLKEAYERVETITALKERNRIAREIHDTVGHTLTTVLVEMEAAKRLIRKDTDLAACKLSLAQSQVKKGLNDIRNSVRILEKGQDILDFYSDMESIIAETEKHSGVIIKAQIDYNIAFTKSQEKVILSALLEGLTNGIKHGKSSAFLFKLYSNNEKVLFSLEDNGMGADIVTHGFGLRAMRERILELNGSLDISSKLGEGFGIYITFPYSKKTDDEIS